MEIYISSDFGKSWVFVGLLDQFPKDFVEQVLFKAGYATRVLYGNKAAEYSQGLFADGLVHRKKRTAFCLTL